MFQFVRRHSGGKDTWIWRKTSEVKVVSVSKHHALYSYIRNAYKPDRDEGNWLASRSGHCTPSMTAM